MKTPNTDRSRGMRIAASLLPAAKAVSSVRFTSMVMAAAVAALPAQLTAQTAPAASAAASAPADTVRLNPFEVTAAVDDSFNTSTVGTGGRLVLDLKDVPASYAVINRAFIDALGITDINEAASWAAGQSFEPSSNLGNSDGQFGRFQQRGLNQFTTPNSTNSSGASTGTQRNFFQNSAAGTQDAYAVETFDFGQGPNGILFGGAQSTGQFQGSAGAAGLAGVQSTQTKKARLDRTLTSISAELGAWDYRRFTIDYNRPITERIGVRVNAVELDSHGFIDHRETQKRGIQIATTIRLSNTADLSIEMSYDKGNVNAPQTPQENVSGWDGMTVARGLIDSAMMPNTVNNSSASLSKSYGSIFGTSTPVAWAGEPNGVQRVGGNANNYYWDYSTNTIVNWRGMITTRRADSGSRTPLWSKSAPNGQFFVRGTRQSTTLANGASANRDVSFGVSERSWLNNTGLPLDMFDRAVANSKFYTLGIRENMSFEGPAQENRSRDLQFSFSQRLGNNFAIGLQGDINRNQVDGRLMGRQVRGIQIDLNQTLPDGSPNPHFLEPYVASGGDGIGIQHSITSDQGIRANAQYNLNAGKWGAYVFNVNANANTREYDYGLYQLAITSAPNDPALNIQTRDPRSWVLSSPVRMQMYQSYTKNGAGYREPRTLTNFTLINSQWVGTGNEGDANPFTPTVTKSAVQTQWALNAQGPAPAVIQSFLSQQLALQTTGRWLDGKIVFLGGYRRDYNKTMTQQIMLPAFQPTIDNIQRPIGYQHVPSGRWDGVTRYFKPKFPGSMTDYYKLTYQPRDASGNKVGSPRLAAARPMTTVSTGGADGGQLNGTFQVMDPRYANDQFRDDWGVPDLISRGSTKTYGATFNLTSWLSPYINKSDQILPATLSSASTSTPPVDIVGNPLKDMLAKGTDFGTRFSFFNGKLTGKINYYDTIRYNAPAGNNVINNINTLINSNRWDDKDPANGATTAINQLGIVPLNGNGDYQTSSNYGWDAEISSQILPGLRLTLNGGASSRATDNTTFFPLTKAYMSNPDHIAEFRALLEDAGGSLDTTQKPVNNGRPVNAAPGFAINTFLPGKGIGLDTTAAVNAYNNLWIEYDRLATNTTRVKNPSSMNFFADYVLQSGKARGLRIGAGVQWQGGTAGNNNGNNKANNTILFNDPTLGQVAIDDPTVNNSDLIWSSGSLRTQANLSYTFRLKDNRTLALALRVNNIAVTPLRYGLVMRQPEGDLTKPNRTNVTWGNPTEINEPMNFRLTATYTFGGGPRGQ